MIRNWKLLLPFVVIVYFIAFIEIDIGQAEHTWNDVYDTYLPASYSKSMANPDIQSLNPNLADAILLSSCRHTTAPLPVLKNKILSLDHTKILLIKHFIRNCIWLL